MGTVSKLLVYYGHGEAIFGTLLEKIERAIQGDIPTPLCDALNTFGSDKASRHNYSIFYHHLFASLLPNPERILEIGLGTNYSDIPCNMGAEGQPGASLRAWRSYFPQAAIYGADVDRRILFQDDRIETLYVDQTDLASVISLCAHLPDRFDLILDDGLHELDANATFLLGTKHKLKQTGLYIVEDIYMSTENILGFDRLFNSCVMSGFLFRLPNRPDSMDNAVAVLCGPDWPGS